MNSTNNISEKAYLQYILIKENDSTIHNKFLRIDILGKGCSGFDYSLSFQTPLQNDTQLNYSYKENIVDVYLSEFAAQYLKNGFIDYNFDPSNNIDQFMVSNREEHKFKGKFWLK